MNSGHGFVFMDWLAVAACAVAFLMHLAVYRDRTVRESPLCDAARLVAAVGYLMLTTRWGYALLSNGDLLVPPAAELAVTLTALAQAILAAATLAGERIDPWDRDTVPMERERPLGKGNGGARAENAL